MDRHDMPHPAPRLDLCRRARAFSLTEMLVVVVIIGILLSIGLAVGPGILGKGRETNTRVRMENLKSVLTVYRQKTGTIPINLAGDDFWNNYREPYIVDDDAVGLENGDLTITDNDSDDAREEMQQRSILQFAAITFTVPDIREAFYTNRQLEFERHIKLDNEGNPVGESGHIVIQDGWETPMIYCDGKQATLDGPASFLREPDNNQPFFASAGPDKQWGDHEQLENRLDGDDLSDSAERAADAASDNIYSFDLDQ